MKNNDNDNIKVFTLGTCDVGGKNYRFDYDHGKYLIYTVKDEDAQLTASFTDKNEAYEKWNEIKRPEKSKKN